MAAGSSVGAVFPEAVRPTVEHGCAVDAHFGGDSGVGVGGRCSSGRSDRGWRRCGRVGTMVTAALGGELAESFLVALVEMVFEVG